MGPLVGEPLVSWRSMQRIYPCELTPEQYVASERHRQVVPETVCPRCGRNEGLRRHGSYERGITNGVGRAMVLRVARFRCVACRRTVSYLPDFALSYRLVQAATLEAFLEGKLERRDVTRQQTLLEDYRRRLTRYAAVLWRTVGCGLGRAPPALAAGVWPWLKEACGSLTTAARRLVAQFRITLFARYQCHQPAEV
jgi:transposase-like protein